MYGATPSGLIELLLFYGGLLVSACLCLIAICLTLVPKKFRKTSIYCAVGSMMCSAISGFSFVLLLLSGVVSKGHGAALGWFIFIPLLISAIICWFGCRGLFQR